MTGCLTLKFVFDILKSALYIVFSELPSNYLIFLPKMTHDRQPFRLRMGLRSKGQAIFEYVLLLGLFVVVIFVFMKFGGVLAKGFKSVSLHVARMAP